MLLDFINENLALVSSGAIIFLLSLIQISPIKINPWSSLAKFIGRAINKELIEKVDIMSKKIEESKKDNDEKWITLKRSYILRFGDEILHGVKHSKEHFDQILLDISEYEQYCIINPDYKNNVAIATIELIKNTYQECLIKNSFL